jgi:uracil-DNA glycosylase
MTHPFDPGYAKEPFASLAAEYPGEDVYPPNAFRTEWGPVFHRGRLDGTARILVLGQDPAAHEAVARRILVGEAGQRVQGLLARLGVEHSYVYLNTFVYSVYGQHSGEAHIDDDGITEYRNAWIAAVAERSPIAAVLTLGRLARTAFRAVPAGVLGTHVHAAALHPTYPDSAAASGTTTFAEAMKRLCESWNAALGVLSPVVEPDVARPLVPYGDQLTEADLAPIPARDLPAGLPAWMRSLDAWATRTGDDPDAKRATITVRVPPAAATWPH